MPTRNAIAYTLDHLLRVAFPNFANTIETDGSRAEATVAGIRIVFPLVDTDSHQKMMNGKLSAERLEAPTGKEIPAFRCRDEEGIYSVEETAITLHYDFISLPFVMLSRTDELLTDERDTHGRALYKNSVAAKYDLIEIPIVDEYALLLRSIIQKEFPDTQITPRESAFISTHDIDLISRFGGFYTNLHTLAADLFKYRSLKQFSTSMAQFRACRRDELRDPYILAVEMLLEQDRTNKRRSLFFFKSLRSGDPDATYDIFGAQAAHLIRTVTERGGEIGLHGSYFSYDNASCFNKEKLYLENVAECPITQGRQHFLRFDAKKTPSVWQNCGLKDDFTLGYAEREGFRCGTCHPFKLYDIANDRPLQVTEHPLIAMDGTFQQYQEYTPQEALQKIRQLQQTCESVEGDFILLWHNTFVWREYTPWYEEVFCKM
jgi:hypothetical protein